MKVGVVIISHNNENHIVHAINSIKNQTFKDWITVCVDNGSTDKTFSIVEETTLNDPRFSAIKKSNEGPSAGRNLGFSLLPGEVEYIHFLDGDDILHPDFLKIMIDYLDNNPQVGLLGCQFNVIDFYGNFISKGHRSRFAPSFLGIPKDIPKKEYFTPFVSFFSATGQGPFAVFRKSVYEKTGGYLLLSHEDTDIFCRMSLLAEVHYLPLLLYNKRKHNNNLAFSPSYRKTHNVFREKWDLYTSTDPKINSTIENSLKYYYTRHKPLRDIKVSAKAFREFIKHGKPNSLKWSLQCLKNGIIDITIKRSFKTRLAQRKSLNIKDIL